ncbi:MAG: hypothetical protein RLZZ444_3794 [Pseudomonadota bacterium]|jgi:uncharacterized protein (TIGR02444 family)
MSDSEKARELDQALWQFMLAVYARPGVQAACLKLQEDCDIDVVLLLTWLYHTLDGRIPLGASDIVALQHHVGEWRDRTVLPLRAIRTDLRIDSVDMPDEARETLREKIKALELGAERTQVSMIAEWLVARPPAVSSDPETALPVLAKRAGAISEPLAVLRREAASV